MKHVSLLLGVLLISMSSMAQMYLWQGGQSTPANLDSITFSTNAKPDNTFIVKPSMATIQANYTLQLTLTKNALPATSYRWTSSNEGVAVVSEQGEVTGIAAGMAIISATAGTRSQTCILTVRDINDLWLQETEATMFVGATKQLSYKWSPNYYEIPTVDWTSSNPAIASVDEQGVITALSEGVATIFATHNDLTDSCSVTVIKPQDVSIVFVPSSYTIPIDGEALRLTPKITPANISVGVNWTSSDNNVATVDENGNVTPHSIGETTITAAVKGTTVSSSCTIKVTSFEGSLTFAEAYIGIEDCDTSKTVVYEHSTLGTLNVYVAKGRIQLFTKGLYFNDSGRLDGAKRCGWIYINAPLALAFPDKNKNNTNMAQYPDGVSFSMGDYTIDLNPADTNDIKWHHAQKGYVDNQKFMGYMNKWLEDFNKKGEFTQDNYQNFAYAGVRGLGGTKFILKQYAVDEYDKGSYEAYPNWLWEYTPNGIVTGGKLYVSGKEGSSRFMQKIDYMNVNVKFVATDTTGIPGVYSVEEDGKYVIKSTGVEFGEERNYVTGTKPAEAPVKARGNGGINIFVDHIIPHVSELPATNATDIILPKEANLLSVRK